MSSSSSPQASGYLATTKPPSKQSSSSTPMVVAQDKLHVAQSNREAKTTPKLPGKRARKFLRKKKPHCGGFKRYSGNRKKAYGPKEDIQFKAASIQATRTNKRGHNYYRTNSVINSRKTPGNHSLLDAFRAAVGDSSVLSANDIVEAAGSNHSPSAGYAVKHLVEAMKKNSLPFNLERVFKTPSRKSDNPSFAEMLEIEGVLIALVEPKNKIEGDPDHFITVNSYTSTIYDCCEPMEER
mmetsp:Transcript_12099/g.26892  ORF Transcript_12099/g.26892 Transcript_12099/m.26892 type:complete len:239 (+) Transcript_12099:370-1086(+)